jgi:hypothetical protein
MEAQMDNSHKKQFWLMLNVAMELTNHPPLTKEAIVTWWHLLAKYEYNEVETAIDKWVKDMGKPPTPSDILKLCQHKVTIHARLPSPLSQESNQAHAKEVVQYVAEHIKAPIDRRQWARDLISGKKISNWDGAINFAKEALKMPLV